MNWKISSLNENLRLYPYFEHFTLKNPSKIILTILSGSHFEIAGAEGSKGRKLLYCQFCPLEEHLNLNELFKDGESEVEFHVIVYF